jgi:Ca2+/Na+ antiporter
MEFLFPETSEDVKHHTGTVVMTTLWQVLVQTGLYGYILFVAANMIGDNAELLLLVPEYATLVGSVVLPILGAVPDGMMVLFSGFGPNPQQEVSVGVGALAGSTIMLLTLPWFLSIVVGRVSIDEKGTLNYNPPKDQPKLKPEHKYSLMHSGVTILPDLKKNAKIMLATSLSYLIIQGPALAFDTQAAKPSKKEVDKEAGEENIFAWIGLVVCMGFFVGYIYLMYKGSKGDDRKIVETTVAAITDGKLTLRAAMMQFNDVSWDTLSSSRLDTLGTGLITTDNKSEQEVIEQVRRMCKVLAPFFTCYDLDHNNQITIQEFRMLLNDLHENVTPQRAEQIFNAADTDNSGSISFDEFTACMVAFALDPSAKLRAKENRANPPTVPRRASAIGAALDVEKQEGEEEEEDDIPEDLADLAPEEQQRRIKKRAFTGLFYGTVLVVIFSDPMVDMLGLIGTLTGVSKFIIAFLIGPLASNASELISSMKLASKRTPKGMVSALSTLEGAAIMNNSFVLSIFLILCVWKGLAWEFTAETVSILLIQIIIGAITLLKKTQTLLDGIIILLCYPGALVIFQGLKALKLD